MKLAILVTSVFLFLITGFQTYESEDKTTPKISKLEKTAKQGNAEAQYKLGDMYYNGEDYKKAFYWYEKAAKQDHVLAQYSLGAMYEFVKGVSKNYKKAFYWYEKAAKQDHVLAQYSLGAMYDFGRGVLQDYKKAFHWYEKAAKQGHALAQYSLGLMYQYGNGVSKNYIQAYVFSNLALSGSITEFIRKQINKSISLLEEKMTSNQIAKAQKLSSEFKPISRSHASDQ